MLLSKFAAKKKVTDKYVYRRGTYGSLSIGKAIQLFQILYTKSNFNYKLRFDLS